MKKVILIGGSPYSGKTALACELASIWKYRCISTDDLGAAIRAFNPNNKTINPMLRFSFQDYYLRKTNSELASDTVKQHDKIWPAIKGVITAHATWDSPAIIEGWAIYPDKAVSLRNPEIGSLFIIAGKKVIKNRIEADKSFLEGCQNKKELIQKYLERNLWHTAKIEKLAKQCNANILRIESQIPLSKLASIAMKLVKKQ
jgi:2-phosphoglycerate kinase